LHLIMKACEAPSQVAEAQQLTPPGRTILGCPTINAAHDVALVDEYSRRRLCDVEDSGDRVVGGVGGRSSRAGDAGNNKSCIPATEGARELMHLRKYYICGYMNYKRERVSCHPTCPSHDIPITTRQALSPFPRCVSTFAWRGKEGNTFGDELCRFNRAQSS
jgi:hypothetical protein